MTNPEAKVKLEVRRLLLEQDYMYFNMPVPSGYGESMLDFVGCHRGQFFMVETKAPGKHLTPRQELTKENVETACGRVFVVGEEVYGDIDLAPAFSGMDELQAWLRRPL